MADFDVVIKVDNTEAVRSALKTQIEEALTRIGLKCESYAKANCPVKTGRLRNSLTNKVDMSEKAVYIGTDVEYGKWVEKGHTVRGSKTNFWPGRPFLGPAAEDHVAEWKSIAEAALKS